MLIHFGVIFLFYVCTVAIVHLLHATSQGTRERTLAVPPTYILHSSHHLDQLEGAIRLLAIHTFRRGHSLNVVLLYEDPTPQITKMVNVMNRWQGIALTLQTDAAAYDPHTACCEHTQTYITMKDIYYKFQACSTNQSIHS